MESTRIPRGLLKAIAATVSPTVEPGANRCIRLLPASMTYLNEEKPRSFDDNRFMTAVETYRKLRVSIVTAVGLFKRDDVAPNVPVVPARRTPTVAPRYNMRAIL